MPKNLAPAPVTFEILRNGFPDPPFSFHTRPLWFWNGPLTPEETRTIMERGRDEDGYAGFSILPAPGMTPAFMTPEFLSQYRAALDIAAELGLKMCLYDEFWFPSGSAGGLLPALHPEALSRRLDLSETVFQGPGLVHLPLPPGAFMGAVAMEQTSLERLDLSAFAQEDHLHWTAPAGHWRIMLFGCVIDEKQELVDYLDPARVALFVELTYGAYFAAFPEHFGTTIDSAFYDEPTLYRVSGARNWTDGFNGKFEQARGYSPVSLYPALWHDIGPETVAARNALFGFRTELFSRGFIQTLNNWAEAHGIFLTGHVDQEEVVNPVGVSGDLIKIFEHQDIPGVDQIIAFGRGSKTYKVVSSAASGYDRPLVMAECYGAETGMPAPDLYREAMALFVKGVNWMVPHTVWYDPETLVFEPELSPRHPVYGPELPAYNRFMARLHWLLQRGRHVADVTALYPIAALQGGYHFSDLDVWRRDASGSGLSGNRRAAGNGPALRLYVSAPGSTQGAVRGAGRTPAPGQPAQLRGIPGCCSSRLGDRLGRQSRQAPAVLGAGRSGGRDDAPAWPCSGIRRRRGTSSRHRSAVRPGAGHGGACQCRGRTRVFFACARCGLPQRSPR